MSPSNPVRSSSTIKQRVALALLVVAALFFIEGWMVLCFCPGGFMISGALCVVPIAIGERLLRTVAILLCGASLVAASHMYRKDEELKGKLQYMRVHNAKPRP